jgi:hypothetical protein
MPPKRRPGLLSTRSQDTESIAQRRLRLGITSQINALPSAPSAPSLREVVATTSSSRADAPVIKHARRGDPARAISADSTLGFSTLLDNLIRDRDSASAAGGRVSLLRTWSTFHAQVFGALDDPASVPLYPATARTVTAVAALFKAGDYRSFANYLSALKAQHIEHGFVWDQLLEATGRWTTRSVLRGIGPARQSAPFKLHRLLQLDDSEPPLCAGGPCYPLRSTLLSVIFLLREIEMSCAKFGDWTFDHGLLEVSWNLTASKSDPRALGTLRTWGCLCSTPSLPCPFHLALLQHSWLQGFAERMGVELSELPLFPANDGQHCLKAAVVLTFEHLAVLCDQPLVSAAGLRLFGGHSARVTGAQSLAALGIDIQKLRILARHSGDAILRYIGESPLRSITSEVASSSAGPSRPSQLAAKTLARVHELLDAQSSRLDALALLVTTCPDRVYVQNLTTSVLHSARPGDGERTACGWFIGTSTRRRAGIRFHDSFQTHPYWLMCERCLLPERTAAQLISSAREQPLSEAE